MPQLSPHQQRVLDERCELLQRRDRLIAFGKTAGFACMNAGIEYIPFGTIEEHNQAEGWHGAPL